MGEKKKTESFFDGLDYLVIETDEETSREIARISFNCDVEVAAGCRIRAKWRADENAQEKVRQAQEAERIRKENWLVYRTITAR